MKFLRKNNPIFSLLILVIFTLNILSCDKKKNNDSEDSSSSKTSNIALLISTSNSLLNQSLHIKQNTNSSTKMLNACNVTIGASSHSGNCFTPLSVKAKSAQLNAGSSLGGIPIRLLNFTASATNSGLDSPFGILGVAPFDFSNPQAITNTYSEDNIQDGTVSTIYNRIIVDMRSLEMTIEIPSSNTNVSSKFWTIRYPFIPQDLTTITGYSDCASQDPHIAELATSALGKIYSSPSSFSIGDVLLCQKSLSTDTCLDSDFEYINSTDGTTSTTRPSTPVQLTGSYLLAHSSSCSITGTNPSLSLGYINFESNLANGFKAEKTNTNGNYSYDISSGCESSSTCNSGVLRQGNTATITISYDMIQSVFAPSDIDLNTETEANLKKNLHRILLKPLYVINNRTSEGNGNSPELNSTINFELSTTLPTSVKDSYDDF